MLVQVQNQGSLTIARVRAMGPALSQGVRRCLASIWDESAYLQRAGAHVPF